MRLRRSIGVVVLGCVFTLPTAAADQTALPECASAADCSALVADAIARSEFERAHDLAWRAVQLGPRNDPALMYLLARAQSVSGRPHDALVMLRRLAGLGFRADEIETLDDFRRVRSLDDWPATLELLRSAAVAPVAAPASAGRTGDRRRASGANRAATRDRGTSRCAVSPPAAPESTRPAASLPAPALPAAPAAIAETPTATPEAAASEVRPSSVEDGTPGLRVRTAPVALAYDSVSDRFVVADERSDTLKIVDERTGNVVDLVSRGWSGAYRPVALAIDARRGDLWAAGIDSSTGTPRSTIYKLQLVSGRMLETIPMPEDAGPLQVIDLAIGRDTIFLLDAAGQRIFALPAGGGAVRIAASLKTVTSPASVAAASDSRLYIAHADGLSRLDVGRRSPLPVPVPAAVDLADIESISWHDGSLFAVQRRASGHAVARIQLDAGGAAAISLETLGPAASRAGAVYGGVFYYVATAADGGLILRGTRAR